MSQIKPVDILIINRLFAMEGGFVLDFSNQTFAQFFKDELAVDINNSKYSTDGPSKAKRLRCFLRLENHTVAVKTLKALWDYRKIVRSLNPTSENFDDAESQYIELLARLEGRPAVTPTDSQARPIFESKQIGLLKSKLLLFQFFLCSK